MVVFMNEADMRTRGIAEGDEVEIESLAEDGKRRVVGGFWVKPYSIPVGSIGAYYPETNPLLPLAYHDLKSGTPAAKSIPVLVRPSGSRCSPIPSGSHDTGEERPMDLTAFLLSRLQFAFTVSFHIIFPSFTIGLAAWLTVLEALHLATGRPVYRLVFEFWLKIFGVAFGLGVVSGIVMAFQFGTNWSELSRMSGPIQGPLLSYETFTAFLLEASFFGILLFGRPRVTAVVLSVFDRDGGAGHHALGLLDHGQQQLDAGAGRLCRRERPVRPRPIGSRSSSVRWSGCAFRTCCSRPT